jgi:mitogen-activated protein kinase kinase
MKRKNVKGLALKAPAPKPPPTAETARLGPAHGKNNDNADQLEIGIEFNLDLKPEDLEIIKDLGAGNGGTVSKVKHIPTNTVMARKVGQRVPARQVQQTLTDEDRSSTSKPRRKCASE